MPDIGSFQDKSLFFSKISDYKKEMKASFKKLIPSSIRFLLRQALNPIENFQVWIDYKETFSKLSFLRKDISEIKPTGKKVLIASLSDSIFQIKLEAFLAAGLALRGWKVFVLTNSRNNLIAKKYFGAFGIQKFLYWDEINTSNANLKKVKEEAEEFITKTPLEFKEVKKWRFEESWIGPQILSTLSRQIHRGSPDLTSSENQALLKKNLPQTMVGVLKAKALISELQPDSVFGVEANYSLMGPIVDATISNGRKFIQVTQPSRDDALVIRKLDSTNRRIHVNTLTKESFESLFQTIEWNETKERELETEFANRYGGKWFLQRRNQPTVEELPIPKIQDFLGLDKQKRTAVIFSHILWDANLFYGEDLFEDYEDWFLQTVEAAIRNPNINWIVKLHPANIWKRARDKVEGELTEEYLVRTKFGKLPDHVKLLKPDTKISTFSLFQLSDFGITVRGTAGMEMPCFGKLVFTAGTGRYSGFGFTIDSDSKEEYLEKLSKIQDFSTPSYENTLRAKVFAYGVFKLRPFELKSIKCFFNYKKKGHHALDHNLTLTANSLDEINNNRDLSRWAKWVEFDSAIDYINTDRRYE